ncbi:MAG: folate-binding protein YgfZ [Proteobacteria bacterium]|nr:folate-binding protein YgfZ [Pseudomonadota bacterium]
MTVAHLTDRAVIDISGPETGNFLQGLITNDVEILDAGEALYAALLTPQGKILFDFLAARSGDTVFLDCAAAAREALVKRLTLYRLRTKVTITARDDLAVVAAWNTGPLHGLVFDDPRFNALGRRAIVEKKEIPTDAVGADVYLARRLGLGVPESADFGQDKIFALDAGLEELQGVSFEKGCYVGQELTARMKHRGTARKRLLAIVSQDGENLPADSQVSAGGKTLGEIVSVYGAQGFALIRLDRLEEAADAELIANTVRVTITKPAWLSA